ncbi:hypothetical protein Tco_1034350 [Tanacetum coccineum]
MCSLLNHHIEHNSRLQLMSSWPPTEDKMSLTLKSKVHKKQSVPNIAFRVDAYSVRVDPNVDYAFVDSGISSNHGQTVKPESVLELGTANPEKARFQVEQVN